MRAAWRAPAASASRSTRPGVQNGSNVAATTVAERRKRGGHELPLDRHRNRRRLCGPVGSRFRDVSRPHSLRARCTRGGERLPELAASRSAGGRRAGSTASADSITSTSTGAKIGPLRRDRRRARLDRGGDLRAGVRPRTGAARRALPRAARRRPTRRSLLWPRRRQPLGRDVGERAGHVADRRQRVGLVELGKPEIEQPDRDLGLLLDEHVRRLHVAVDDPEAVCVRERRRGSAPAISTASRSVSLPARSASRIVVPVHVLVGDVDVAAVAAEVVGADAPLVAQPRGGLHLSRRTRRALALARDDLEGDLEPGALVAGEPDGAGAAASERSEGPVAVEDELAVGEGRGGVRHGHRLFAAAGAVLRAEASRRLGPVP